jgi:hypothetical protein
MSRLKKIHNFILIFTVSSILHSCSLRITNKRNVVHFSKGVLFVTPNHDFVYCASTNKSTLLGEHGKELLMQNQFNGFSLYGKYDKCLRQKVNRIFNEWNAIFIVKKENYVNSCKTNQLNSLLYESDSVKVIPVDIEYRLRRKVNYVGQNKKSIKERFCFENGRGNMLSVIYSIEDEIYIYDINPRE